jgi:cytochrome c oxidase assembly factor CtaG/putative copper export protein
VPRLLRIAAPATLLLTAVLACAAALAIGGGAAPELIADAGEVVRFGLPFSKLAVNIGAAVTIGALAIAAFALDAGSRAYALALDIAAAAAGLWTVAAAATGFFSFLAAYQIPLSLDEEFGNYLGGFLATREIGQAWLATTLAAAVLTILAFAVRNQSVVLAMAVGAVLALVPMALQGHSGDESSHDEAISAIWVHIVAAAVWLGGLVTIALVARAVDARRLGDLVGRYSSLALAAFVAVVASGYVSAELRVGTLDNLLTPYGILVLVKVGALVALGLFGIAYRRFFIARLSTDGDRRRWFWSLVVAELAFMGIASGTAAALARTATPIDLSASPSVSTAAQVLTESPLPPPVTVELLFTSWSFDLVWVLFCGFAAFFYIAGVVRLRRRGDSWPWYRTVLWLLGLALLFWVTNGGVNVYQKYLFSQHMLGHMTLGMMIPVLLVPAAPITLALRAVRKREDGSRGVREWLLLIVHSRYFGFLTNPIVSAVIFAGSLWVFYYSAVFRWATVDHVGHEWMVIHFLGAGYLFVSSLIGVDPAPNRAPYPIRLMVLLATMAFHAFFGLALMSGSGLLLADWYGAMGWGTDALVDQQTGGGIAWSVGEIPTVTLAIVVALMWSRSDGRAAKRYDRKAERDGDAELEEYNAMLASRAARPTPPVR